MKYLLILFIKTTTQFPTLHTNDGSRPCMPPVFTKPIRYQMIFHLFSAAHMQISSTFHDDPTLFTHDAAYKVTDMQQSTSRIMIDGMELC